MTHFLSISPQIVAVAPGSPMPSSEVEDFIAGRKREFSDTMYQAEFQRLISPEKDVSASSLGQNVLRNFGSLR